MIQRTSNILTALKLPYLDMLMRVREHTGFSFARACLSKIHDAVMKNAKTVTQNYNDVNHQISQKFQQSLTYNCYSKITTSETTTKSH